ncbi:MAG: polysaccharide biosynthesis/export family protein, partial [Terriglobales bacterium]
MPKTGWRGLGLAVALALLPVWGARAQAPPTVAEPPPAAQRLQPGDLIDISVFEAPELATAARLDAAGAITMPAAGRVELGGETAAEAEQALAARLGADYLVAPQVHVTVREFAPQPVTVLGAVKYPGMYSARTYPNLEAMLAAAGGLEAAAGERILVTAAGGEAAGRPPLELSGAQLSGKTGAPAVTLHAGDVVRVAPAASVYVGGDVAKPGAYILPASGLSLVEALSLAGGVGRDGSTRHTRIVHRDAAGHASIEWVDAAPILEGSEPDPGLRAFDLVYV